MEYGLRSPFLGKSPVCPAGERRLGIIATARLVPCLITYRAVTVRCRSVERVSEVALPASAAVTVMV
jgi:hypothetical protein